MTQQTHTQSPASLASASGWLGRWGRVRLGLVAGLVVAAFVLVLWGANLFVRLRLSLSDLLYIRQPTNGQIVLVAIDEDTLAEYGALLSWDRTRYAEAVTTLAEAGARVIALDILFAEPNPGDTALAQALAEATANGSQTVLAASGVNRLPSSVAGPGGIAFRQQLGPVPALAEAASHVALTNAFPGPDNTIRTTASVFYIDDEQHLSFALASYLAYFRVSGALAPQVVDVTPTAFSLPPDVTIPTQPGGLWMPNYFGDGAGPSPAFEVVSFRDVTAGTTDPAQFEDKLVIIGLMDVVGAVDRYPTPISQFGNMMAGAEIQANATETLLQNNALRPEPRASQAATVILLALLAGVAGAYPRWYGTLAVGLFILAGWGVYASLMFSGWGVVVNPLHPVLTVALVTLVSIGVRISLEIVARRQAEGALSSLVAVSEQRMELSNILRLVTADVRHLAGAQAGVIWLADVYGVLSPAQAWGDLDPTPHTERSQQAYRAEATQQHPDMLMVPCCWQGRGVGLLALAGTYTASQQASLERFAARLAPSLENALLYQQTQRQKQLLGSVLANSPAGIMVLDAELTLSQFNEAAARSLDLYMDDIVGRPLGEVVAGGPLEADTWASMEAHLKALEDFQQELKLAGKTYRLEAKRMAASRRWLLTLIDISDLAELNHLKTRMLRMASHDLKNPLGRIIGYSELFLEMGEELEVNEQATNFINRIYDSAEEMVKIITEILDLEHVRSGRMDREWLDMTLLVRDVVQRHRGDIANRQQTLTLDLPDEPVMVHGDYNHLIQATSNLVGNASKYTPAEGTITVRLWASDGQARLDVQDTGYGMPADALDKLFTEFYRIRTEATQNIEGTGLGLSLVKGVVEAHDGRVWVETELDVGSTFSVALPQDEGAPNT